MNDRDDIESILDRFREWLDDARPCRGRSSRTRLVRAPTLRPAAPARDFGIIDLVEEFTALRHELKLQTKSGRGLIEQTENTVAALRQAIEQIPIGRAQRTSGRVDGRQGARRSPRRPR